MATYQITILLILIIFLLLFPLIRYYLIQKKISFRFWRSKETKSIELEQKLVEKEKQYQDIYETANSIIIRWNPDFIIYAINPYAEDFFSLKSKDVEGKDLVKDLFNVREEKINQMKSLLWNIFHLPDQFIRQEYEVYLKNNEPRTISWSNRIFRNTAGYPYEVLSIGNDITNRKMTEEKLKLAVEEAKSANKPKSIFFSKITHELRTPLHAVIGFSQILAKDPALPSHLKGYVGSLHQNGVHLLNMINDLLDLSKIEAGKMTENPERLTISQLWETLFSMFVYQFIEKGITLKLVNKNILNDKFYLADFQKILQILVNLLANALKFTTRGEVTLDIMIIEKPSKENKTFDVVRFKVTDTGIGIPEDQLNIIFEAFHQTEIGSSYQKGTGLGLSISLQLVEFLGGMMSVKSKLGEGSEFEFQIPLTISLAAEDSKFINSHEIVHHSSDEIRIEKGHETNELEIVKSFINSLEENLKFEILGLIRHQNFSELQSCLARLPKPNKALDILEEKSSDKKFKFFIDLSQSF